MTQYELQIATNLELADQAREISARCEREGLLGHAEIFKTEAESLESEAFARIRGSEACNTN
jgi:hypothetical protein